MKLYELVIQHQQPSCGGKPPFRTEILDVRTDDPVAYVRQLEPDCDLDIIQSDDSTVFIKTTHNGAFVKYEFSRYGED